jgi:Family of unknown function (DUF6090)
MLRFFSKIRLKLAGENKAGRYLRYAVGEILLVVIGILIALQINNWNAQKNEEEKTRLLIEQVYSAIKQDIDNLKSNIIFYNDQLKYCDIVMNSPDSLSDQEFTEMLFYLDAIPYDNFQADKFADELNFESIAKKHIKLVAQIKNFLIANLSKEYLNREILKKDYIQPILIEQGLPQIESYFGFSTYFGFNQNKGWFTDSDFKKVKQLLSSGILQTPVKSVKLKIQSRIALSGYIIEDGNYLLNEIKQEFPDLRLMYDHVGIIGSSLQTGMKESVPMKLMDEYKSIWEIDIKLTEGTVKFRTRNSWTQNWGGVTFPKGYAQSFAKEIPIPEPGFYHVELNLSDNTYEFKKLDN